MTILGLDLIVEERIREAMRAGAFDGLPGAGRPLDLDDDRMVPEDLRMAFRILRNAGFVPPELEQRKEAADLRRLIEAGTEARVDDDTRRRAIARLALIETALEARGGALPRAAAYHERIVARLARR